MWVQEKKNLGLVNEDCMFLNNYILSLHFLKILTDILKEEYVFIFPSYIYKLRALKTDKTYSILNNCEKYSLEC